MLFRSVPSPVCSRNTSAHTQARGPTPAAPVASPSRPRVTSTSTGSPMLTASKPAWPREWVARCIPQGWRWRGSLGKSSHQCWSLSTLFVGKPAPVHLSQANFRPLQLPICPGTFQAVPRMKEPFLFQSSLPGDQVRLLFQSPVGTGTDLDLFDAAVYAL